MAQLIQEILPDYDEEISRVRSEVYLRSHQLWEEEIVFIDGRYFAISAYCETDVVNAWYKTACEYHEEPAYRYLADTGLLVENDGQTASHSISIWEQHQKIILGAVQQKLKIFEIMKLIPLNHPKWLPDFADVFTNAQIADLYSALEVVFQIGDAELRIYGTTLIREYIEEIKVQQLVEKMMFPK